MKSLLPSFLVPFVTFSYPVTAPAVPDSFYRSSYYKTGLLDVCFVVTCIAVMAVLRDVTRLGLLEPFARWKLTRDVENSKKIKVNGQALGLANGHSNGNALYPNVRRTTQKEERKMHRKVLRFAEQGWSVTYYSLTWCYGLVRVSYLDCDHNKLT
jgi:acyl-CoA-dependent ceramide synthase